MINKPKLKKTTQHCLSLIILNHLQHTPWLYLHGQQIGSHLQLSAASSQPPAEGSLACDLPPHAKRTTFKLLPDHPDIYDWTRSTKGVCMRVDVSMHVWSSTAAKHLPPHPGPDSPSEQANVCVHTHNH